MRSSEYVPLETFQTIAPNESKSSDLTTFFRLIATNIDGHSSQITKFFRSANKITLLALENRVPWF